MRYAILILLFVITYAMLFEIWCKVRTVLDYQKDVKELLEMKNVVKEFSRLDGHYAQ